MQKEIVTQSETAGIANKLTAMSSNLEEHVNQSLSKAHGINVLDVPYSDSGGDVMGQRSLRITVGNSVVYAPALTASPDPGPASTSSGSVSATDGSDDTTVGVPNATAVVTRFAAPIEDAIDAVISTLGFHAGQAAESVHGDITEISNVILDNRGHKVGRKAIVLKVNGVTYAIPTDVLLGGPPQIPRLSPGCPYFTGTHDSGGGTHCALEETSSDGNGGIYDFSMQCLSGTGPIAYNWQFSVNGGAAWGDFVQSHQVVSTNGWFGATPNNSAKPPSGVSNEGAFTTTMRIRFEDRVTNTSKYLSPGYLIRCKFSNASIEGGGIVYSGTVFCAMRFNSDDGGCWICTEINKLKPLSEEQRALMKVAKHLVARRAPCFGVFYLRYCGELTSRMRVAKFDWTSLFDFEDNFFGLLKEEKYEEALTIYRSVVFEMVRKYWPDCQNKFYLKSLAEV